MKMRIGTKLMLTAVLGVLAVVSAVSLTAYCIARGGLEKQTDAHLESVGPVFGAFRRMVLTRPPSYRA